METGEGQTRITRCVSGSAHGPQFAPFGGYGRAAICAGQSNFAQSDPAWPNPANDQLGVPVQRLKYLLNGLFNLNRTHNVRTSIRLVEQCRCRLARTVVGIGPQVGVRGQGDVGRTVP